MAAGLNTRMWENVLGRRFSDAQITSYQQTPSGVYGKFEWEGEIVLGTFEGSFFTDGRTIKTIPAVPADYTPDWER